MVNRHGTVRQRRLGRRLRRLREQAGHTLETAAAELEVSPSKVARIETARQNADLHVVKSMLDLYDIGGDQWAEVLDMVREARKKAWWRAYGLHERDFFVKFEADAALVHEYSAGFVPGLLQIPCHSRALFESSLVRGTQDQVEKLVEVRMIRQRRLTAEDESRLQLVAIINEAVLHNPVGGPAVHAEQLAHLIDAADLPTVTLQVLPARSGAHPGLASGFTVLSFGDLGEPDMAYVEHALGAAYLEGEQEVGLARKQFDMLRTLALRPADSLALLRELAAAT